jgi:hypothetical protein
MANQDGYDHLRESADDEVIRRIKRANQLRQIADEEEITREYGDFRICAFGCKSATDHVIHHIPPAFSQIYAIMLDATKDQGGQSEMDSDDAMRHYETGLLSPYDDVQMIREAKVKLEYVEDPTLKQITDKIIEQLDELLEKISNYEV